MIRLSKLKGKGFILNAELIKFVEETPDTLITLLNNEKVFVAESADDVVGKVIEFNRRKHLISE